MGYALPTPTDWVSSSWWDHKNRNPPSSEPGTDYGCAYGQPVFAPGNGVVNDIKTSNSGGTGRYVAIALDDGRTTRVLHLSAIHVGMWQRVGRGQHIATSGASGYNSDWYYGPHAHQTLWPHGAWANPTIDFAVYVGDEPAPEPPPKKRRKTNMVHAAWRDDNGSIMIQYFPRGRMTEISDINYWNGIHAATGADLAQITNAQYQGLKSLYGTVPYAAADMEHANGLVMIRSLDSGELYLMAGGKLFPIAADNTREYLEGRVPELALAQVEIENIIENTASEIAR